MRSKNYRLKRSRIVDVTEPNTISHLPLGLCSLYRHWYGRPGTRTFRAGAWRVAGYYRRNGISLPHIQLCVPVSLRLVGRPLGPQTGHGSGTLHSGGTFAALPGDF